MALEVFRLNGSLIVAGDRPLARLARSMGLHGQGAQRIVNELAAKSIVTLDDTPHRRAKLVRLTKKGEVLYRAAERKQKPWATKLAKGIGVKATVSARAVLTAVRERLEAVAIRA
ncbi:MarR family transcriptional regulator [Bradyrhizobium sp. USDA 10063]